MCFSAGASFGASAVLAGIGSTSINKTTAPRLRLLAAMPLLFAAQLCLGLGQGIGYPVLLGMSIQHVAETERATAMGLHQAIYAVGMFAGPWLSGLLAEAIGLRPMFGVTAGVCLMLGWLGSRWLAR